MKIINNILKNSPCFKAGRKIVPKGLMIHSVGTPQPDAKVFIKIWETSTQACAHAVMGVDGIVYQALPWNHRGWHAGSPANNMFISIELTEPSSIRYTSGASFVDNNPELTREHVQTTYKEAVAFAAYISREYELDPLDSNQLLSHHEGYKKGYATDHADVEHLWSRFGLSMEQFRKDVKAFIDDEEDNVDKWIFQEGKWWYRHGDGGYTMNKWELINKEWYYFDESGWMKTGWIQDKEKWYYLEDNGAMVFNSLKQINNKFYAFASDGHMMKTLEDGSLI
jgi:hypothetical protein